MDLVLVLSHIKTYFCDRNDAFSGPSRLSLIRGLYTVFFMAAQKQNHKGMYKSKYGT